MRAQPKQALYRDDGSAPDKGPFRTSDVFIIKVWGEEVSQEDGPDDCKGPDVGMQVERHYMGSVSRFGYQGRGKTHKDCAKLPMQ